MQADGDDRSISRDADPSSLEALRDNIASVLDDEADSRKLHAFIDGRDDLDARLWRVAADLGWLAVGLPEAYGGLGLGARGLQLLYVQLGRRLVPGPFLATLAAAQTLAEVAEEGVKARWLPEIVSGECRVAVPAVVLHPSDGAADWFLGAPDADLALTRAENGAWALVELGDAAEPVEMWDRTRTVFRAELSGRARLATLTDGANVESSLARQMALGAAADATGGARAILEQTVAYMKERRQFDRPIASFQALKHRAADLMTLVVSGEEVLGLAVDSAERGERSADAWSLLAKARQTDAYVQVATECLQLHGGVGFTSEFDVHLHLKRARLNEMLAVSNYKARDLAAEGLAVLARAGSSILELA